MNHETYGYGLWGMVILNSAIFLVFIFGGFLLLASAWRVLYKAQRTHELAVTGSYAYIRHPQYAAFILIMVGFLLQWPTSFPLVIFPILVFVYVRLAHRDRKSTRLHSS